MQTVKYFLFNFKFLWINYTKSDFYILTYYPLVINLKTAYIKNTYNKTYTLGGKMARYINDILLNKPNDFVTFMMNDYLQKNGFSMSTWKGEPAFRAGDAMLEGYKFLKWSYNGSVLHVEAWLKSSFGSEMGLDGYVGCLQKKPFKDSLEQLYVLLKQDIPMPDQQAYPGGQPMPQAIPVQTVDNVSAAKLSLVFGIASVILAFIWPLIGFIVSILGFSQARLGGGSSKANLAKAGKVLSIIGLVLSIIIWLLNIILNVLLL